MGKKTFFNLFLTLFIADVVLIGLAILFYRGHYQGWVYPFSYAGHYRTWAEGNPNILSMILYSLSMAVSGAIMIVMGYKYYRVNGGTSGIIKPLIYFLAGGGFLIASLSPNDIRHSTHVMGSAMAIASLWIITTSYLFEIKNNLKPVTYYFLQAFLQLPIFTYAATYFLNIDPASSIIQKFSLATLVIILLYAAYVKENTVNPKINAHYCHPEEPKDLGLVT